MNKLWQIWKYALGSFSDDKTAPYDDFITIVRTLILITYLTTNGFIIYGVTRTHIFPVGQRLVDNTRNPDNCHLLEKQL